MYIITIFEENRKTLSLNSTNLQRKLILSLYLIGLTQATWKYLFYAISKSTKYNILTRINMRKLLLTFLLLFPIIVFGQNKTATTQESSDQIEIIKSELKHCLEENKKLVEKLDKVQYALNLQIDHLRLELKEYSIENVGTSHEFGKAHEKIKLQLDLHGNELNTSRDKINGISLKIKDVKSEDINAHLANVGICLSLIGILITFGIAVVGIYLPYTQRKKNIKMIQKELAKIEVISNSIEEFTKKTKSNAEQARINRLISEAIASKNSNKKIEFYNKVIELDGTHSKAYNSRGIVYREEKSYNKAMEDFNSALKLDEKFTNAYNNKGLSYYEQEEFDNAIENFNKAIETDKDYYNAYYNLGKTYFKKEKYKEALENYNKVIKLNSKFGIVYRKKADLYAKLNPKCTEPDIDPTLALDNYSLAIALYPSDIIAYYSRAEQYIILNKNSEAITDYKRVLELNPSYAGASHKIALAYSNKKDYKTAIGYYSKAIALEPDSAELFYKRGSLYKLINETKYAIDDFDKTIELDTEFTHAYFRRANMHPNDEKYEKAILDYTSVVAIDFKYCDAYYERGKLYIILKKYEEAIKEYTNIIIFDKKNIDVYNDRGNAYFKLGNYVEAIVDYTHTIEYYERDLKEQEIPYLKVLKNKLKLNSKYNEAYYKRGNAYFKLKNYEKAIVDYTNILSYNPKYSDVKIKRGNACVMIGDYSNAIKDYSNHKKFNLKEVDVSLLIEQKLTLKKSLLYFDKLIKSNSDSAKAYYCRGTAYSYIEKYKNRIAKESNNSKIKSVANPIIIEDYTRAIELDPKYIDAYNNLAWFYYSYDDENNLNKALYYVNESIKIESKNPEAYRLRESIYNKLAKKEKIQKGKEQYEEFALQDKQMLERLINEATQIKI